MTIPHGKEAMNEMDKLEFLLAGWTPDEYTDTVSSPFDLDASGLAMAGGPPPVEYGAYELTAGMWTLTRDGEEIRLFGSITSLLDDWANRGDAHVTVPTRLTPASVVHMFESHGWHMTFLDGAEMPTWETTVDGEAMIADLWFVGCWMLGRAGTDEVKVETFSSPSSLLRYWSEELALTVPALD